MKAWLLLCATAAMYGSCLWAFSCVKKRILQEGLPFGKWPQRAACVHGICVLLTAIWFAVAFLAYDLCYTRLGFLQITVVAVATMAAAITDFKLKIIPNALSLFLLAAGTVMHIIGLVISAKNGDFSSKATELLLYNLVAMLAVFLFLLLAARLAGGMGAGDIKLLSTMCYAGGFSLVLTTLSVGLLAAALCSAIFLVCKVKRLKDDIPFAPFIAFGCILSIALGLV